jgi:hypothetical protein
LASVQGLAVAIMGGQKGAGMSGAPLTIKGGRDSRATSMGSGRPAGGDRAPRDCDAGGLWPQRKQVHPHCRSRGNDRGHPSGRSGDDRSADDCNDCRHH